MLLDKEGKLVATNLHGEQLAMHTDSVMASLTKKHVALPTQPPSAR